MDSRINVKPCPFCGNSNVSLKNGLVFGTLVFICKKCGADVMFYGGEKSVEIALAKWNSRCQK